MFIKLTNTEGKEFWLNSAHILTLGPRESGTIIKLTNRESYFEVEEETPEILKQLNKTRSK